MKKLLLYVFLITGICITGCDARVSQVDSSQAESIVSSLSYFKDTATGLCFAGIGSGRIDKATDANVSITCVPCDSLKRVYLKNK